MKNQNDNSCPFCKSKNIARILYGMPASSKKLDKDIKSGKLILGGCFVSDNSPVFQCNECGKKWGERGSHSKG